MARMKQHEVKYALNRVQDIQGSIRRKIEDKWDKTKPEMVRLDNQIRVKAIMAGKAKLPKNYNHDRYSGYSSYYDKIPLDDFTYDKEITKPYDDYQKAREKWEAGRSKDLDRLEAYATKVQDELILGSVEEAIAWLADLESFEV